MKLWLALLILFLYSFAATAADVCGPVADPLASLQQVSKSVCMDTLKSKACQDLFAKMRAANENPEDKALKCHDQSSVSRIAETSWSFVSGCAIGGWNFVAGIGMAIGDSATQFVTDMEAEKIANVACDADPQGKEKLFIEFNKGLPKLMQVPKPADSVLAGRSCAAVKGTIQVLQSQNANDAFVSMNKKIASGSRNFSADEQEYIEWTRGKLKGRDIDLVAAAKDKLQEIGVKLECYNFQAATAMVCEAIAEVATLAGGPAALALKVARLKNIAKIAGITVDAEKTATASRMVATAADLEKAAKLTNAERIAAAEKSLGRALSESEQKALIQAHEFAANTGRGYGSYSSADLKSKSDLLKQAGFSESERNLLLRQGLAGSLSSTQSAKAFANSMRLQAEKLRGAGKAAEAKQSFKSAADSYEVMLNDVKYTKSDRDYWVGAKINASAERYDKASDYFIKSFTSESSADKRAQAVYEALNREKEQLRVISNQNKGSAAAQTNYQTHRKLIEAVVNNPQLRMSDALKSELLRP